MKKMGDCVIAMRKSLTARFMMKKLGGVCSFLLLKRLSSVTHKRRPKSCRITLEFQSDTDARLCHFRRALPKIQ